MSSSSDDYCCQKQDLYGKLINKYAFIYLLGMGSNANVWLCYDTELDKIVAIKVLDPNDYQSGIEENKILKKIQELNCPFLGGSQYSFENKIDNKKTIFIVLELLGVSLNKLYKLKLSDEFIKKVIYQCKVGLETLHKNNITHCDIKPENILTTILPEKIKKIINQFKKYNFQQIYKNGKIKNKLIDYEKKRKYKTLLIKEINNHMNEFLKNIDNDDDNDVILDVEQGNIKITDFGLFCQDDEYHTKSFGTLYYMAPEILLHLKQTNKVDIWALGCTIYELITGIMLFDPPKDNYDRKYHHFYKMQRLFGKIPINMLNKSKISKHYFDKKGNVKDFDDDDYDDFEEYFVEKGINKNYLPFFRKCLELDPSKREISSNCS
jgi:serine/threonine protein kinase